MEETKQPVGAVENTDSNLKALQGELQGAVKALREVTEKKDAKPAIDKDTGKLVYAEQKDVNEKLKALHEKINGTEDKIKTLSLRKESNYKFGTIEGLAKNFIPKGANSATEAKFLKLAKSIIDDPNGEEYNKGFQRVIRAKSAHDSKRMFSELQEKILGSSVDAESSFIKKALTTIVGEGGGYFCPPEVELTIRKNEYETSPVRQFCKTQMISRGDFETHLEREEPEALWEDSEVKGSEETATNVFIKQKISTHELRAEPKVSLNIIEDSLVDIEGILINGLSNRFSRAENRAVIRGDGVKRPQGLVEYAKSGEVDVDNYKKPLAIGQIATSGTDGDLSADDLLNLEAALLSAYKGNACYLMSRVTKNVVRQLKDSRGQYLLSMGLGFGGFQGLPKVNEGLGWSLLGYPVYECDDLVSANSSGTNYPVFFGDFSNYLILDRIGMYMIIDDITEKGYRKYYTRKRLGGALTKGQAIKVLKQTKA